MNIINCELCGGPLEYLGTLGYSLKFRCRNCHDITGSEMVEDYFGEPDEDFYIDNF